MGLDRYVAVRNNIRSDAYMKNMEAPPMTIAEIPRTLAPALTETSIVSRVGLLTVEDVAEFLQVKPARVYEAVKQRRLRALRVGRLLRFRTQDLEAFLERSATREGTR